ncbi:hypothetical protein Anas_10431 [Armadillidium nasatum]|uniref:Helicase C-terminal domain-containing protein n=1 Tax=Armadillidium nasatum TaxID=96803 RepID=A0A5N5SNA0_9CRUS|nr:hypothetical protein Anas_10431 [Armadillidium nasatum]
MQEADALTEEVEGDVVWDDFISGEGETKQQQKSLKNFDLGNNQSSVEAVIEEAFDNHSELNQILNFSTPKVLRLIDILRQIRPLNFVDPRKRRDKGDSGSNSAANKEEDNSANKCSSCGCRFEPSEGETNSIVKLDKNKSLSPSEDDKGCEKLCNERENSCTSEDERKKSLDVLQEQNIDNCQNLLNGTTERCDLLQTSLPSVSLSSGCDAISSSHSALYCNGQVSRTDSEESVAVDSNSVDSHSVPNSDSLGASESLESNINETELLTTPAESTTLISDTAALPPEVEISSEIQSTVEAASKQPKVDVPCSCSCHNKSSEGSSQPLPVISFVNGCDTPSEDKELDESSPDITKGDLKGSSEGGKTLIEENTIHAQNDLDIDVYDSDLKADLKPEEEVELGDTPSETPLENDRDITNVEVESINSEEVEERSSHCGDISRREVALETSEVESDNEMSSVVSVDEDALKSEKQDTSSIEEIDKTTREETLVPDGCDKTEVKEVKHNDINSSDNSEDVVVSNCDNKIGDEANEGEKSTTKAPTSEAVAMADTLAQLLPNAVRTRRRRDEVREKVKVHNPDDPDSVCGLIFVQQRTTAKIIYRLLKELSDIGGEFSWIFPQYTVELCKKASDDPRAAEAEHRKQEEVFRRFRHHECNLLVSTSVLEEGIDIPNCNLGLKSIDKLPAEVPVPIFYNAAGEPYITPTGVSFHGILL